VSGRGAVVAVAVRYWAAVFAVGFVLGTVRTLWLAPRLGVLPAVLAELPPMLTASWLVARRLLARRPLVSRGAALQAGALAFLLLLASEAALAVWGLGQSRAQWTRALATPAGPYEHVRASRDGTRLVLGSDDGKEANVSVSLDLSRATSPAG